MKKVVLFLTLIFLPILPGCLDLKIDLEVSRDGEIWGKVVMLTEFQSVYDALKFSIKQEFAGFDMPEVRFNDRAKTITITGYLKKEYYKLEDDYGYYDPITEDTGKLQKKKLWIRPFDSELRSLSWQELAKYGKGMGRYKVTIRVHGDVIEAESYIRMGERSAPDYIGQRHVQFSGDLAYFNLTRFSVNYKPPADGVFRRVLLSLVFVAVAAAAAVIILVVRGRGRGWL